MRAVAAALLLVAGPAAARTWEVGPGLPVTSFAAAAAQAGDGDTIHLSAGHYYECAVLRAKNLTVQGDGVGSVLTDATCQGKAILVAQGDGLVVRDLVLARARVPDENGAGVRLEAQGLTLERVRFVNDEVGVLAGGGGPGVVRVTECRFEGGGVAGERPGWALWVGPVERLVVERSVFAGVKGGQVNTAAGRSELVGNRIETGSAAGASYAVMASGGVLAMRDNALAVGPFSPPRDGAVLAEGNGAELVGNRLENGTGHPEALLLDWMQASPAMSGNVIQGGDAEVSSSGMWRHRASDMAHGLVGDARHVAGRAKRALAGLLHR